MIKNRDNANIISRRCRHDYTVNNTFFINTSTGNNNVDATLDDDTDSCV